MRKSRGISARQRRAAWIFLAPSLAGVAAFTGIPFLDVMRRSFSDPMGKVFVGLTNYRGVLKNEAFRLAAGNTVKFLVVCIPLLMALSFLLALLVRGGDTKGGLFKTSLVLPMVIPVAAVVLVWKIFLCRDGLLNQVLGRDMDWISGSTAFPVLIVTYIWKNAGYDLLLWMAGLASISENLYDAAKVDGAGPFDMMRYITLPGLQGTMGLVLILSVVNSFRVYREAYLLAGSYPDMTIYMIPHLFSHWFLNLDVQNMCTSSMILVCAALAAAAGGVVIRKGISGRRGRDMRRRTRS